MFKLIKHFLFALCLFTFAAAPAFAQQFHIDVVHLSDGSIIKGIIIEQIPGVSLKIKTQDGSLFVFMMSDVLKITKELSQKHSIQFERKSPGIALALSFLIVGGGQIYNEQAEQAMGHLVTAVGCGLLIYSALEDDTLYSDPDKDNGRIRAALVVGLGNWMISMITAPISAHEINETRQQQIRDFSLLNDRLILAPYASRKGQGAMLSLRF